VADSSQGFRQQLRDIASTWLLAIVVLVVALVVTYQFVGPAPPKQIVLATGEETGAYHHFGKRFAEVLARDGIRLELRQTAGSVENLELLGQDNGVDLAFVQGGVAHLVPTDNVVAIGTLYLEPVWLFVREEATLEDFGDLVGKRVAVGPEGSGTRAVVLNLLEANGVNRGNAELFDLPASDLAAALSSGRIDAAFIIGGPESAAVSNLVRLQGVRLYDVDRAEAYARRNPHLSVLVLPRGVLDLQADLPARDTQTVALGAMLAARQDFHPALIDLLLVAAGEVHGEHSLFADAGQFPTPRFIDLPLSGEAERHFRYGPPFLMRYMPFWAATLVDRLWIMLLPLIGLSIPLAKLVPPAYRWQIRRRLLRLYAELDELDPRRAPLRSDADLANRLRALDGLESDSMIESVPRAYTDDVYKLRRDIDLVRRRLAASSPVDVTNMNE
jgi:TRAP transporter TAXI family solute receptor